ncbi:hypothetical protein VIBC2010_00819 [Vibrio caribbeanicus ATCC BAA-2122]|uniref:Uncharacterized protein n=1 Tax=Vibrio caribbeanicus ATCC BAA-2122 TaxID=796620 RepID=E3BGI5_9VIBR|nr:hypothetical protein VIBC2010_00819 [Vibrio caribbeanicus ATCC BAA-2122]
MAFGQIEGHEPYLHLTLLIEHIERTNSMAALPIIYQICGNNGIVLGNKLRIFGQ